MYSTVPGFSFYPLMTTPYFIPETIFHPKSALARQSTRKKENQTTVNCCLDSNFEVPSPPLSPPRYSYDKIIFL
jgi:hypothetical protein